VSLNLELAKKPPQCLEYVVVHELVHMLERSHNDRFKALMDAYLLSGETTKTAERYCSGAGIVRRPSHAHSGKGRQGASD